MSLLLRYPNQDALYSKIQVTPKDQNLRVPDDGYQYVQFRPDWEIYPDGATRHTEQDREPYPAIVNKAWGLITKYQDVEYESEDLPEKWQWLYWHLFRWSVDNQIPIGKKLGTYQRPGNERIFTHTTPKSLTWYYINFFEAHRFLTEAGSTESGRHDYVTDRNSLEPPFKLLMRPCILNIARVKKDWWSEWELEALDVLKDPPPLDWLVQQRHLLHWANEVHADRTVSNFPQAEACTDIPGLGTPMLFLSKGASIRIKKSGVRLMQPGQLYDPHGE